MTYYNFDRVSNIYDETRVIPEKLKSFFKVEIEDYLQQNFKENCFQVLSLGIGTGRIEGILSSRSIHLFGIDLSPFMLRQLLNKKITPPCFVILGDILSLPFRRKFHLAVAIHLIHLIPNFECFIKEVAKLTDVLVIGDAYTEAYSHPLYQSYQEFLEECGWIKETSQNKKELCIKYLEKKDYPIYKKSYSLPCSMDNSQIYSSLEKKYFSSLWSIPDKIHRKTMKKLREKVQANELKIGGKTKTISNLSILFVELEK
ncbi:MAG: class I SAM-dependent methyltransferase [Candidatus Heimdallarchaeaceae archaeon]